MCYEIVGGNEINGEVEVETSKNALLPIMAASVLASDKVIINNVPNFSDVIVMCDILKDLGASVVLKNKKLIIDPITINKTEISEELSQKLRASIFLMGPILSKFKKVTAYMPGGCKIGKRPIDIHLQGFEELGIKTHIENNKILCDAQCFCGGKIYLRKPSVGATENLIMCSVLFKNRITTIENCAKEPEIVDLCNFLTKLGAKIYGAGTEKIVVVGVEKLGGTTYTPIGDRIIAGTYMIAVAMCKGKLTIKNANIDYNKSLISILSNLGCIIEGDSDNIYITMDNSCSGNINISTGPYPGFPTDLQSQMVSLLCVTNGVHTVEENLFENRFNQIPWLVKMGANIKVINNVAIICGKEKCLNSSIVEAQDLRGGAALVLAALAAKGKSKILNTEYIDRGYENLDIKLSNIGADIQRT